MNLVDVIEGLVEERGLDRKEVISAICEGMKAAYIKKFPDTSFIAKYNQNINEVEIFVDKKVVATVLDDDLEISTRRARAIVSKVNVGDVISVPFLHKVGRIEILTAKQVIANKIRELEQRVIYDEYKQKEGVIISGIIHKRESVGYSIKIGDVMAFLPNINTIPGESMRIGAPIRALLKEVLVAVRGDYQLILDRASTDFVQKLIETEIPEVFEGIVEVKRIVRIPGYKTKILVLSNASEIDPVGTCVGIGGVRIKPLLKELGQEKIDLIQWVDDKEELVKNSLKPAEIDKVEIMGDGKQATVWLAQDQRSYAIGKMGQNISLASRLSGLEIQLQNVSSPHEELEFEEKL